MITFEHTRDNRPVGDRPPSLLTAVVLAVCALVLLPFTLLCLLCWGLWRLGRGAEPAG